MLVKAHCVGMVAKADFDLFLHHGLLDKSQVDIQVRHKQRVGKLDDCAAGRNNDGIALVCGNDGRDTALLSGLDSHIGLGSHAKLEPAHVVEHVLVTLGVHVQQHVFAYLPKASAHALELVGVGVAAALVRLVVLVALEGRSCSSRLTGWVADEGELLGRDLQGQLANGGNGLAVALAAMGHVGWVCRKVWRWWLKA
eukprot:6211897-Pleurochrysis_carterae.AAC.3